MESRIYRFEIRICCFPRYNLSANVTQTNPRCHGSTRVVECTHGFEAVQGASPEVTESVRALVVPTYSSWEVQKSEKTCRFWLFTLRLLTVPSLSILDSNAKNCLLFSTYVYSVGNCLLHPT